MYAHFQNQDVTGGGLKGVQEANQERVLDVLQDSKLVGDLVTLHQLLVHKLSGHCSFGSLLVTFLNDREPAPGTQGGIVRPLRVSRRKGPVSPRGRDAF